MQKVSIRLPGNVIDAYDDADGTRSAVMRRRLVEAVEDGEVDGVGEDLKTLVEREAAVDRGRLARKRGKFKQRCYDFFRDCWQGGAVTPSDASDLAESWEAEAAIYGAEHMAFVEAVVEWYREEWDAIERSPFPDPGVFVARSDPDSVAVGPKLVEVLDEARREGFDRADAVDRVSSFHPDAAVERAAQEAYGDE
jgi:hypothetical protein